MQNLTSIRRFMEGLLESRKLSRMAVSLKLTCREGALAFAIIFMRMRSLYFSRGKVDQIEAATLHSLPENPANQAFFWSFLKEFDFNLEFLDKATYKIPKICEKQELHNENTCHSREAQKSSSSGSDGRSNPTLILPRLMRLPSFCSIRSIQFWWCSDSQCPVRAMSSEA